ncbi:MAG: sialic acid TRAP transporter substrate-binding protein SiaP [Chloroflexota bacterium]|nr:sialic acid TRAP transporter substrate-binding protein SiaP [Chloroflexota bacterium]
MRKIGTMALVVAFAATAAPTTILAADEPVVLQFSTQSVPDDHHTKAIYKFEELVEASSDGSIAVEVFDSGSLFDQNAEQTALLRGDIAMAYTSSQWLSERVPAASIVGVPYMISDVDHLYAVMDGQVGQDIFAAAVDEAGVRPLTSIYLGTRQLNLTDKVGKVMTPADLDGVKLRVPDSPSWIAMGEALGANPTPVAFGELYLALQTGTVDGQDNPLPTNFNAKFYEVTDQIVLTGHLVNDVWPTINEEVWQSLSEDQQNLVTEAWLGARDYATDIALQAEADLVSFFEGEGLEVYEPDRDAFRTHVLDELLGNEELTSTFTEGHYDIIQELAG